MISRRMFVAGAAMLAGGCATPRLAEEEHQAAFEAIRATLGPGARMGVAALDTGTNRAIGFDADSRYAMASTFKAPLAAAILAQSEASGRSLTDQIRFGPEALLEYAPVVRANLTRGSLSLAELCAAIVEVSDNSAANLLLAQLGGPEGLTRFIRRCGDTVTRLDRNEPALNSNLPGDVRDTTTPAAMLSLMRVLLTGNVLAPASRDRLLSWMVRASTGLKRLRAGLPSDWVTGDKTGTGANGAANDVAIAWPPGRHPILITAYQSGGDASPEVRNAAHASVARLVVAAFA